MPISTAKCSVPTAVSRNQPFLLQLQLLLMQQPLHQQQRSADRICSETTTINPPNTFKIQISMPTSFFLHQQILVSFNSIINSLNQQRLSARLLGYQRSKWKHLKVIQWNGACGLNFLSPQTTDFLCQKLAYLQTLTIGKERQSLARFGCNSAIRQPWRNPRDDLDNLTTVQQFVRRVQSWLRSTHHKNSHVVFSSFVSNLEETFLTLGFAQDLISTIFVRIAVIKLLRHERIQGT